MEKKPLILVSGNGCMDEYGIAIEKNGGIAHLAYLPEYREEYDGLLLSGGCDVEPFRYGQEVMGATPGDRERDACEIALIRTFAAKGKPIFGICRGLQILNVGFGGTLIQHLSGTRHSKPENDPHLSIHCVESAPDSLIRAVYGERFISNSWHHEAAERLAPGFRVTAVCPDDGVTEAIEHPQKPWFAVQFHPELMLDPNNGTADGNLIFRAFLEKCN